MDLFMDIKLYPLAQLQPLRHWRDSSSGPGLLRSDSGPVVRTSVPTPNSRFAFGPLAGGALHVACLYFTYCTVLNTY